MTSEEGLLGGIAGAFSGLTSADVDALALVGAGPVESPAGTRGHRAIDVDVDATAREVAERLLRRSATNPDRGGGRWEVIDEATHRIIVLDHAVEVGRGSADSDDIRLASSCAHVSRQHCRIAVNGDGSAVVSDLGSANGTVVLRADATIPVGSSPVAMVDGDRIATLDGLRVIATVRHQAVGDDR